MEKFKMPSCGQSTRNKRECCVNYKERHWPVLNKNLLGCNKPEESSSKLIGKIANSDSNANNIKTASDSSPTF